MTSDPKSFSSLKKYTARHPGSAELAKIMEGLVIDTNSRSCALATGAILEGALKLAIIPKIIVPEKEGEIDLFGNQAPLRAFSAKIKMGFALGLYGVKTRADLDSIREVRNAFAHSMAPLEFDTAQIANVCARITFPERANLEAKLPMEPMDARLHYVLSACWLAVSFDNMGEASTWSKPTEAEDPVTVALSDGVTRAIAE